MINNLNNPQVKYLGILLTENVVNNIWLVLEILEANIYHFKMIVVFWINAEKIENQIDSMIVQYNINHHKELEILTISEENLNEIETWKSTILFLKEEEEQFIVIWQ